MDDDGPARQGRAASSTASSPAARRTRSTRSAAATCTARCASRRRRRPPTATRASCASGGSSRRSTAPTCRTPRRSRVCDDPSVLGRTFYLMGFVDGWSPMDLDDGSGRRRSTPTSTRGRAWPTSWSRASRCCRRSTGRPRACRTSAGPTASTSARSTGGPRSSSGSRAASSPGFDEAIGVAARPPADRLHPRPHARRLPVRQRDVPARRARRGWPRSSTGRWARSATRSSTSAGWCRAGPTTRRTPRRRRRGYVDMNGMPSRDEVLDHYAEVSGRQVDDIDYYIVLAKWKLAIVLEQGFQRAGDDEKLQAFGPIVLDLMRAPPTSPRSTRLPSADVRAAVCPAYGPPEVVRVEERPSPALDDGQVRVRRRRRGGELPRRAARRQPVPDQRAAAVRAGQRVRRRRRRGRPTGSDDLAVGDRVIGTGIVGAFAEEVVVAADGADPDPGRRRRPHGGRVRRGPPHGVPRAALGRRLQPGDELVVLGAGGGVGLAAVQLGRAGRRRSPPSRRRPRSSTRQRHTAPRTSSTTASGDLRAALRDALPDGADVVVDPVGGDSPSPRCGRCAGAAGS